jgi:hypothetical protein
MRASTSGDPAPKRTGDQWRTLILGAAICGDLDALRRALAEFAAIWSVTDQYALAALLEWLFRQGLGDDSDFAIEDLERLPAATLEVYVICLARVLYSPAPQSTLVS